MIPNNKENFAIACISTSRHSICSSHKNIRIEALMFFPRLNHTLNPLNPVNVLKISRYEKPLVMDIG